MGRIYNGLLFARELLREVLTLTDKIDFPPSLYTSQNGKTWIVTGSTSGIGFLVAEQLAKVGANVWLVGRNEAKIKDCIAAIKHVVPEADLDYFVADFMDLESVRSGAHKFLNSKGQLNGIVHNAGYLDYKPVQTKQGYEAHFAVNCLAPWLLQKLLDPVLIKSSETTPGRIVWVSSLTHWGAAFSGDELAKDPSQSANDEDMYFSSKAVNIMQSIQWTKQHPDASVKSLSVHPGVNKTKMNDVATGFSEWLLGKLSWDPKYGATVELAAALGDFPNNSYLVPWGKVGRVREDIVMAGDSPVFGEWLDNAVKQYT